MNRTIGLITANYIVAGYGDLTAKRPPATIPFDGRFRLISVDLLDQITGGHLVVLDEAVDGGIAGDVKTFAVFYFEISVFVDFHRTNDVRNGGKNYC